MWTAFASIIFILLNTVMRSLALQVHPSQVQFLRYVAAVAVMLPLIARAGPRAYLPHRVGGQFARGALHTVGLTLWFIALPHIPMADMTAIGFTGPIFVMLGAYLFFKERMQWDRWLAAGLGFAGVLVVVAPGLSGSGGLYSLVMLASAPVFAASFLLTKTLTRSDRATVIVLWQAITVSLLSFPLAWWHWTAPTPLQWSGFLLAGLLGSAAHYCVARGLAVADASATQSVKFLDLVWSALMGWLVFSEIPTQTTLIGGVVICSATIWIARREARARNG